MVLLQSPFISSHDRGMKRNEQSSPYDVVIIGGGSAGYAAARTAAAAGLRVAVIEGGEDVGGLCILRGCMPSKALLYAAEVRNLTRQSTVWGLQPQPAGFDFGQVMARKNALIKEFADDRSRQLTNGQFSFLRAEAQFADAHTLNLSTGDQLTARHFVIATGSRVAPPPLPQLRDVGYLTSDDVLRMTRLPKSMLVLGGGAVGVELAQFLARFDVKITLLQRSAHVLSHFDPDATSVLETVLRRDGVEVLTDTQLQDAWQKNGLKGVSFVHQGRQVERMAEEILYALGRVPNTDQLDLHRAQVQTEKGRIITNDQMQTSAPHIYAAGDCTGPHEIVHIAVQQGEIAAHNIAFPARPRALDTRLLIMVAFTDPQLATVGLTEREAQKGGAAYRAASYPFNDHGKSLIMEAKDGFVKLLANPTNGEIIGGACVGPSGGELIHEIVVAMHHHTTVAELAAMPHYHPTLAEIWTYPAEALMAEGGTSSP